MCRTGLIRSVLLRSDPGASNGGSNLQIRHFGADMQSHEVAGLSESRRLHANIIGCSNFWILAIQRLYDSSCWPQCVGFASLTFQDQTFTALWSSSVRHTLDQLIPTSGENCWRKRAKFWVFFYAQNSKGKTFDFFLAAITKGKKPNFAILGTFLYAAKRQKKNIRFFLPFFGVPFSN